MSGPSNAARPAPGTLLATLETIPNFCAVAVDFAAGDQRWSAIVVRRGGGAFAYENRCPHAGYPLERPDGRVVVQQNRYLICSAHGASFDLATGACAGGPCARGLTPVAVRIEAGAVLLG